MRSAADALGEEIEKVVPGSQMREVVRSGKPVLLRVDFEAGHGGGTLDQLIDETTDVFAFLLWQTGAAGFALP